MATKLIIHNVRVMGPKMELSCPFSFYNNIIIKYWCKFSKYLYASRYNVIQYVRTMILLKLNIMIFFFSMWLLKKT